MIRVKNGGLDSITLIIIGIFGHCIELVFRSVYCSSLWWIVIVIVRCCMANFHQFYNRDKTEKWTNYHWIFIYMCVCVCLCINDFLLQKEKKKNSYWYLYRLNLNISFCIRILGMSEYLYLCCRCRSWIYHPENV